MAINRDKVLQEAQKLVEKKRFDKAILEYQRVVAEDPSDVRTLLKIGDLYLKLEQHADAISMYERVGQFYSAQGFSVKAVAVYKQIRDIIQKHVPHLEDRFGHIVPKLAELLTSLGLTSDALAYYDEMATRLQRIGRDRDAIDIFKKIVSLDPDNPLSHLRLADALIRVRDLDGAVEEYATASKLLLGMNRQDDALRVVERILQHRQDAKYARLAAEICLSRGKPNDAMMALQKVALCIKENAKDLDALALLARAFDQLGQPTKAIEVQKEAARIAREGSRVEVFHALVETLQKRAPNDEGVKALVAQAAEPASPETEVDSPLSDSVEIVDDDFDLEEVSEASRRRAPIPPAPSSRGDDPPFQLRQSGLPAQPAPSPAAASSALGKPASGNPALGNPAVRVRQMLAQVESLRQRGDYHHAILTLQTAVSGMPFARELREKLCDILIESGDQDQAIVEMLGFASYLAQSEDPDGAARLLDEVLLLDPTNQDALTMLQQLGYAVPESAEGVSEISYEAADSYHPAAAQQPAPYGNYPNQHPGVPNVTGPFPQAQMPAPLGRGPNYHESAPLPAFDLDSDEPQLPSGAPAPRTGFAPPPMALDDPFDRGGEAGLVELDDPFANDGPNTGQTQIIQPAPPRMPAAPMPPQIPVPPQMPLPPQVPRGYANAPYAPPPPEEEIQYAEPEHDYGRALPSFPMAEEATSYGLALDPQQIHPVASRPPEGQLDEAALEEIEFFQTHGMLEEAVGLLTEQLSRLPNHPLLLERKRELDQLMGGPVESQAAPSREPPSQVDRSFDIASALGSLDALEQVAPPPSAEPVGQQQISVETVFEQFKAGVAAQIADSDAATHYDLGVAYKEMGLFSDSIAEFELASRDPTRECVCQSMIGMMHIEHGNLDQAIDAFLRGLRSAHKSTEQEIALTYEIGNAYEIRKNGDQALYYFQLVGRLDPNYRDPRGSVEERISNLTEEAAPPARAAAGGDDEFDQAFDDLFDGPKKR